MRNRIKQLLVITLLSSCNPRETKEVNLVALSHQVVGTYEASLPCADCVSIEYQIEILPDSTFAEHVTYLGREDGIYEVHGNWTLTEDSILTAKAALEGANLFVRHDGTLQLIETNGTRTHILQRAGKISNQQTLLNNTWVLETLRRKELSGEHFSKEKPHLEFRNIDHKVLGFSGCNALTGPFTINGNQISMGPFELTRMACNGIDERLFLDVIQETTSYKIKDLNLYLFAGSSELARFKKVD
ncbi:MAG: META domain-containing protein [Cyclobacteriaceae bacterium]|nr:META domain-containing protein [Cyclobacteriaceae bacterium]